MSSNVNAKYLEGIKSLLQTSTVRQLVFMFGITISVALGIVLYMSIQEPTYRPLDYQVTAQNMSSIVDTLEKAGIQYKINDRDNILYVSAKDVQLAKLKLSSAGVPKDDSMNYSFLNDQGGLGNSQFIENARYLRALENDLSKTINAIEGVSGARVHIAMPQSNVFADESGKTTASVMINVSPGFLSDKEKIQAIMQIIAGSVPGLDPKNVAITDQYGHFLSGGMDQSSIFNAAQMNYQNTLQTEYEKRIESMIIPLLGENKVSVRVYANIDFTQQEETEEQYDPDKKVIRSEQASTETSESGGASGAPGSLANSPPSEGGDGDKAAAAPSGGGAGRTQNTKNYELSKSVSYKKSNFAKIKNLSVAVVVDNEMVVDPKTKQKVSKALDADKINKITQLVQTTIGYDQARGDKVTVVNSGFNMAKVDLTPAATHVWDQLWFWDVTKKIIGILFGCIMLLMLYLRLSGYIKAPPAQMKKIANNMLRQEEVEISNSAAAEISAAKQERISQLKQLAATEPNKVAGVIKNWVGKQ